MPIDITDSTCDLQVTEFAGTSLPADVTIVEVGPRDGLQNEKDTVSAQAGRERSSACPVGACPCLLRHA